jgi:tRNA-2-methylthio-N6-dimethylallyladenosine synthase
MPPKKLYIETYGCQMNVADSELMVGVLGRAGYERTDQPAEADVMLVNTCAVRDNVEQRVLGRVGELQRFKRRGHRAAGQRHRVSRLGAL